MLITCPADDKANISPTPQHVGLPARFSSWDELSERICWSTIKMRNQEGPCWRNQISRINSEVCVCVLVTQSWPSLCDPRDCSSPGFSVHQNSPSQNTGVGSHSLLHGIILTQGWNLGLLHCRQILYHLNHQGRIQRKSLLSIWIGLYTINSCHHPDLALPIMGSVSSRQILKDFPLFTDSISA